MRTLGIDLASQPKDTGVCLVAWGHGRAVVEELFVGANDEKLLALHKSSDATGIDAPFGWPKPFVKFVSDHVHQKKRGARVQEWNQLLRDSLRLRCTDLYVRKSTPGAPLSVSSDKIGVTAMRCAGLLSAMGISKRHGHKGVFEVYPAAALRRWELPNRGYKNPNNLDTLALIVAKLAALATWLGPDYHVQEISTNHNAFDALVCALVARAAVLGMTDEYPKQHEKLARVEGWIHLPKEGSLEHLNNP